MKAGSDSSRLFFIIWEGPEVQREIHDEEIYLDVCVASGKKGYLFGPLDLWTLGPVLKNRPYRCSPYMHNPRSTRLTPFILDINLDTIGKPSCKVEIP